jgi:polysaccharide pyruvyl transferase WcaK-like protein
MPVALLTGAFGQGNLGDEALLRAFLAAVPGWDFVVTTDDPVATERLGCEAVPIERPAATARRARAVDAVVFGGGTVFGSPQPPSGQRRRLAGLTRTAALVASSSVSRRPVAMVGVAAGQLEGWPARRLARSIVNHSNLLILSDEESAATLTRAGVAGPLRVGADPAWTLVGAALRNGPFPLGGVRPRAVRVVPSRLAASPDRLERVIDQLVAALSHLVAVDVVVELQAFQHSVVGEDDDVELVDEVARRLVQATGCRAEVVPPPTSMPGAVASLSQTGAVLAYRYHAVVAAAAAGVPSVAVVNAAKLAGLARRLHQQALPSDAGGNGLADAVSQALLATEPDPRLVEREIVRAAEGLRLLRVVLAGGQSDEVDVIGALPLSPTPAVPV